MFNILIITHGKLCIELKSSVEFILDKTINRKIYTICIDENSREFETYSNKISNSLIESKHNIIFTDMFGGTPSNISLPYYKKGFVEIISGVNLPMLLKASTIEINDNFQEAVKMIVNSCKDNIIVAGDLNI
ncbi:PTS fructose transporter subunit IIA [bacterium]|nr:PTS fructose transporter subunit IIA [bacterium]